MAVKRCSAPLHQGANPLPVTEFGRDTTKDDGLRTRCRECTNASNRRWQRSNPEKIRENALRWQEANPEKCREKAQRHRESLRVTVFDHYGRACACPGCGATDDLTIDHVNGDGKQHREAVFGRSNAAGWQFYRWLIRNGFPAGFQVLCKSCNASKKAGNECRLNHAQPEQEAA
jgi:hypothetical protein